MLSNRTTNTNSNNHRRQWSEGIMSTERSSKLYKDDDRQLIQHLVNEYLLEGSNDVLDLIRNCPNECFEALVDFIWTAPLQTTECSDEDVFLYSQRSSLLSSALSNVHRYPARRRLAILFIEIFKLLSIPVLHNGRFDIQRQNRILCFPTYIRHLINFEPDIHGLSCLALASVFLINPLILHHQVNLVVDALKHASNQFVRANLSFDIPSTLAISIYSLFYLLYILYPNILRRELQPENNQVTTSDTPSNRLGVERVLLPMFYHFKLHRNIVCGTVETERHENRWQTESWQSLIANGDRYVVLDDSSTLIKRKEDKSNDSTRFEIEQIIRMCNEYTENVLHQSQIVQTTHEHQYSKKSSNDCSSIYSDSHCQTFEQQWQTTIQNGQMNLSRFQASNESIGQNHHRKDSTSIDQNIHAKVQLQLDMLDCNYEQDKREYYAQLIRDTKKTLSIHDLDRDLKAQEVQYGRLIDIRKERSISMDEVRKRTNEFYQLNETFHNSLSATQVELKTDEDEHWQQHSCLQQKQTKLAEEMIELEKMKKSIENEIGDIQRRLFQSKTDAEQSIEIQQTLDQLHIDLNCARKKHQLLHNAFLNMKFKSTNIDKLVVMYQDHTEQENQNLDEKKLKFEQLKQLLNKQQIDLTAKRNNFHQLRNMNTHKISTIRRQIDSIRICQTQLNMNSQIPSK